MFNRLSWAFLTLAKIKITPYLSSLSLRLLNASLSKSNTESFQLRKIYPWQCTHHCTAEALLILLRPYLNAENSKGSPLWHSKVHQHPVTWPDSTLHELLPQSHFQFFPTRVQCH